MILSRLWHWKRHDEDDQRLAEAEAELRAIRAQRPAVHRAAEQLDRHRDVNNFTRRIRIAMGVETP